MCENEIPVLNEDMNIRPQRPNSLNLKAAEPNCSDDEEIDVVDEGSDSDDDGTSGIYIIRHQTFLY